MSISDQIGVYEQEIQHLLQVDKNDKQAVNEAITRFIAISAELKSIRHGFHLLAFVFGQNILNSHCSSTKMLTLQL